MFRNYLIVALRNLSRKRVYALVNISGLTIGLTVFLLMGLYVLSELRVNGDLKNLDRQYLLGSEWSEQGLGPDITTFSPLGPALKDQYPHLVRNYCRLYGILSNVSVNDKYFREETLVVDSSLLTMYGFEMVEGHASTALQNPNGVVIREQLAKKYFGNTPALGQTLTIETSQRDANPEGKKDYLITGVIKTPAENTVLDFGSTGYNVFLNMENIDYFAGINEDENWQNWFMVGFVELQEGANPEEIPSAFQTLISQHVPEQTQAKVKLNLQSLKNIHLDMGDGSRRRLVYTLSAVALFILLMAIINFVNITIGQSGSRLKEIGIRKVLGGLRRQLIFQFLAESVVLTCLAFGLAMVTSELLAPFFGELIGKPLSMDMLPGSLLVMLMGVSVLATSLLAGFYPALVQSGFSSVESLKGRLHSSKGGQRLKRGLLLVQFFVALILVVSAFTVSRQVNFLLDKDLGYDPDNMMIISSVPRDWSPQGYEQLETLSREFGRIPEVRDISLSFEIPDGRTGFMPSFHPSDASMEASIPLTTVLCDPYYLKTWGLRLTEGKFFREGTDNPLPATVVVNQSTVKAYGWENPLGKQITWEGTSNIFTVVGVLEDFHFSSLHEEIRPMLFMQLNDQPVYRYLSLRLEPGADRDKIGEAWSRLFPETPLVTFYMQDKIDELYQTEIRMKKTAGIAVGLAMAIVLLGLFGLIMQSMSQRMREISIRRVLGARLVHILRLFAGEFALLLLVANLIAWPLAWWLMARWLEGFAYQANQHLGVYFLAMGLIAGLMMGVIFLQTWQASSRNPAEVLRNE